MKKPEASPEIYKKFDEMNARLEERKRNSVFGFASRRWDDVYPLCAAVNRAPKAFTGRSRKRDEDLVLVPRFILDFLTDETLAYVYVNDPTKNKEEKTIDGN